MDEYKDKLLSTVAHDLRNPLNSMIYLIDEASHRESKQLTDIEFDILFGNSKILLALINDILDYCQNKKSNLRLIIEQFSLNDMINEVYSTMSILGKLKNIKLKVKNYISQENLFVNSDRRRIIQILFNLISNSLKFTRIGEIQIKTYKKNENNLIYFSVKDTGSGMTEDVIQKLGQEYNTFGQRTNNNKEGIGLGLHISQQLVSKLGPLKQFSINSKIDVGSTFNFIIFENFDNQDSQYLLSNFSSFSSDLSQSLSEMKSVSHFQQLYLEINAHKIERIKSESNFEEQKINEATILIADDNVFNLFVLQRQLRKLNKNFIIIEARDGKEAIEAYENNNNINLIIMDCDMPIVDGYQASKQIKLISQQNDRNIKIIGYSALMNEEEINKCKEAGMDTSLQKPSPESLLYQTILQQLANQ